MVLWAQRPGHVQNTRRTIFELHAGREDAQLPPDLALDEVSRATGNDGQFPTSARLIEALGPVGKEYARAKEAAYKIDYTFVDPMVVALDHHRGFLEAEKAKEKLELVIKEGKFKYSSKELLVQYLLHVEPLLEYQTRTENPINDNPQLDSALLRVFDDYAVKKLERSGYDITNLMDWAWILKAETVEKAAKRLTVLTHTGVQKQGFFRSVPHFIFLFLLRRQNTNARAVRLLLVYVWKWMEQPGKTVNAMALQNPRAKELANDVNTVRFVIDDPLLMREDMFMVMVIRLLRLARQVWPAACESIVALLCRYLDGVNFHRNSSLSADEASDGEARLTFMYNTILRLLSMPSSLHPFQSALFQQRAQFSLLRRMNKFDPPLLVDRKGYRAVVSMQLMHKKTLREREWARMKARSWPPWKEDKLGIDASIGVEHGISRAREALRRAREAGYAADDWDAAASILSGWDTDGSPTIQTRAVPVTPQNRLLETSLNSRDDNRSAPLWAARVRATRTLDEAWSCFLSYKDQASLLRPSVYYALYDKLVYDEKMKSSGSISHPQNEQTLPGDGKEVLPAPESPKEATYVRIPPPTWDDFFQMMAKDGIKLSGRFLVNLLANAHSFQAGIRYLEASNLAPETVSALLNGDVTRDIEALSKVNSIPQNVLAAFIRLLSRFAPTLSDKQNYDRFALIDTGLHLSLDEDKTQQSHVTSLNNGSQLQSQLESTSPQSRLFNPLSRAFQLLLAIKPRYRPAWYHLLRALASSGTTTEVVSRFADQDYQDIKTWRLICRLLDELKGLDMPVDLEGFLILCIALEKSIFAAEKLSRTEPYHRHMRHGKVDEDTRKSVDLVLSSALSLIKAIFKDTVVADEKQQNIPRSLMNEKSEIDNEMERTDAAAERLDEGTEHDESTESNAFLPPACLLPKLLEVPGPAELHAFIRVLGLRQDYNGIMDLIEWMSLFADDINALADEQRNGRTMMRRCLTAVRVFLERSWMQMRRSGFETWIAEYGGIVVEADPASVEIISAVHEIILENKHWGGWPSDKEVEEYCSKGKFL